MSEWQERKPPHPFMDLMERAVRAQTGAHGPALGRPLDGYRQLEMDLTALRLAIAAGQPDRMLLDLLVGLAGTALRTAVESHLLDGQLRPCHYWSWPVGQMEAHVRLTPTDSEVRYAR